MSVLTFEDGHVEYWSVFSHTSGFKYFDCPKKAKSHIDTTNDLFYGVDFHKELDGISILPSDLAA